MRRITGSMFNNSQKLDIAAFTLGVREELAKRAQFTLDSMPTNENILPTIDRQVKWRYVRTKDGLKLTDGNLVYSFGLPSEFPAEDTPVSRLEDDNILDFERDVVAKGTAQIHRSSPDSVYMTLADGSQNPTFSITHEQGKQWRYSPAKRFLEKLRAIQPEQQAVQPDQSAQEVQSEHSARNAESILIDPESLIAGGQDKVKTAFFDAAGAINGADIAGMMTSGANSLKDLVAWKASAPLLSFGAGYAGASVLGHVRDALNPGRVTQRKMNPGLMRNHDLTPVAAGLLPTVAAGAIMA
jgi:hypothetical protein